MAPGNLRKRSGDMCTNCMDMVTLVHDPYHVVDPFLSKSIIESARYAAYQKDKMHITDDELAVFLIVLGGSLLAWKEE